MYVEFKKGEKHALKGAEVSDDITAFDDCGYLLEKTDVVIDIDSLDKNVIESMIKKFNINTQVVWTDRGAHLYFKKPEGFRRSTGVCALGFPVEFKTCTNTPNGITIRRNGITRTIDNEGIREELPNIFSKNKKFENLMGLGEGDGRNNRLFSHRGKLDNMQGWEKCLRFINEHIFAEPLEEKEFMTITRDVDMNSKDFDESAVAEYFMNEYKIVVFDGAIWYWWQDEYSNNVDKLRRLIYNRVPSKPTRFIDEVIKQIGYKAKLIDNDKVFDIRFNNGILREGKFIEIESQEFTPYRINVDYYDDAEPVKIVDDYINQLTSNDQDYRDFLMEVLGHCLIVNKEVKRSLAHFFIFRGDGGNGKGTLLQIIKTILNGKNCSTLSIGEMEDERYVCTMKNKLANLGDDIEASAINDKRMKMLKNISSCDDISSRELYKNAEQTQFSCTLIFTSNSDITSWEKGDSYKRRVFWLPMFTRVTAEKIDPQFITKLTSQEALQYWVKLIVDGYMRLYQNHQFTKSDIVVEYNEKYHANNNKVEMFLEEIDIEDYEGCTLKEFKTDFQNWLEEIGEESTKVSNKLIKETLWNKHQMGIGHKKQGDSTSRVLLFQSKTNQNIKP